MECPYKWLTGTVSDPARERRTAWHWSLHLLCLLSMCLIQVGRGVKVLQRTHKLSEYPRGCFIHRPSVSCRVSTVRGLQHFLLRTCMSRLVLSPCAGHPGHCLLSSSRMTALCYGVFEFSLANGLWHRPPTEQWMQRHVERFHCRFLHPAKGRKKRKSGQQFDSKMTVLG
ncbi:hypothetical protein DFJ77DRAFT_454362 [Powellomyces hirtus]|nr:hypothetical protein DFJ77DRAFT_454362 [Powellomyces hirtus]